MPGVDGMELCARLRELVETAKVPIYALTAAPLRDGMHRYGFTGHFMKPIEVSHVLSLVT
jgi:CheY-like chemotaxis protein